MFLEPFYDKTGQIIWVADQYIDRALLPKTPVSFSIPVPEDIARKVSNERSDHYRIQRGRFNNEDSDLHFFSRARLHLQRRWRLHKAEALNLPKVVEAGTAFSFKVW